MRWTWTDAHDAGPRTHALVIGVGDYFHLMDGELFSEQKAEALFGLGQLTSPLVSARRFADWIRTSYANRAAPLGSIELMVSSGTEPPPGGTLSLDERARFEEIRAAFNRWVSRCDADRDNVAILYFCGHGLEGSDMLLLPADYGADPGVLFSRAINFSKTFRGMLHCRAGLQLYFLDSCRQRCPDQSLSTAPELKSYQDGKRTFPREAPIYRAASLGGAAFGRQNGVSLFTEALIRSLDGLAAERAENGRWKISTGTLGPALTRTLARISPDGVGRDMCQGENGVPRDIHEVDRAVVLSKITCDPVRALALAHLRAVNQATSCVHARSPDPEPWELELPQGTYDIEARFPSDTYTPARDPGMIVNPPYFTHTLDVR